MIPKILDKTATNLARMNVFLRFSHEFNLAEILACNILKKNHRGWTKKFHRAWGVEEFSKTNTHRRNGAFYIFYYMAKQYSQSYKREYFSFLPNPSVSENKFCSYLL